MSDNTHILRGKAALARLLLWLLKAVTVKPNPNLAGFFVRDDGLIWASDGHRLHAVREPVLAAGLEVQDGPWFPLFPIPRRDFLTEIEINATVASKDMKKRIGELLPDQAPDRILAFNPQYLRDALADASFAAYLCLWSQDDGEFDPKSPFVFVTTDKDERERLTIIMPFQADGKEAVEAVLGWLKTEETDGA